MNVKELKLDTVVKASVALVLVAAVLFATRFEVISSYQGLFYVMNRWTGTVYMVRGGMGVQRIGQVPK